jgi:ribosomal RNA-processing protein 1
MDKYLYLVRQYLYVSFRYLANAGWKDTEMVDDFMSILSDTPLNASDAKIPNGMRYHLLDIYLDELEKVDEEYEADIPAERLLAPYVMLQKECPTKIVRQRAKEILDDERVRKWLSPDQVETAIGTKQGESDGEFRGFED